MTLGGIRPVKLCYVHADGVVVEELEPLLSVANVSHVTPAWAYGAGDVQVTLFGSFPLAGESTAAFVPSDVGMDCEHVDATLFRRLAIAASGASASGQFSFAAPGTYALCVAFAGAEHAVSFGTSAFAVRQVTSILPSRIVGNVDSVVTVAGTSLGDGNVLSFANSTAGTTCADLGERAQFPVTDGRAVVRLSPGTFAACFTWTDDEGPSATQLAHPLFIAQEAAISGMVVESEAVGNRAIRVRVFGVGLGSGDVARFVELSANDTGAGDAVNCTSAAGSSDSMAVIDGFMDGMPAVRLDFGAELVTGVRHALCYRFSNRDEWDGVWRGVLLTLASTPPHVDSVHPLLVDPGTSVDALTVFGTAFSPLDTAAVTSNASCNGVREAAVDFVDDTKVLVPVPPLSPAEGSEWTVCFRSAGGLLRPLVDDRVIVSSCHPQLCQPGQYLCQCRCQDEPCRAVRPACPNVADVRCPATGACVRSPRDCPAAGPCDATRCPGGECAATPSECPSLPICAAGHVRCADGSCAPRSTGCSWRRAQIAAPVCEAGHAADPASGVCFPVAAAARLPFHGCSSERPVACGTCECREHLSDCPTDASGLFLCLDGAARLDPADCGCPIFTTLVHGTRAGNTSLPGLRRRTATAQAPAAIVLAADGETVANVTAPPDLPCHVKFHGVPSSVVAAALSPLALAAVSPAVGLQFEGADGLCVLGRPLQLDFEAPDASSGRPVHCVVISQGTATLQRGENSSSLACVVDAAEMMLVLASPRQTGGAGDDGPGDNPGEHATPTPQVSEPGAGAAGDDASASSGAAARGVSLALLAIAVAAILKV